MSREKDDDTWIRDAALAAAKVLEAAQIQDADDLFGLMPVPGEAVKHRDFDPCAGYTARGRFTRRSDGRPVRLDGLQGRPKTTKGSK